MRIIALILLIIIGVAIDHWWDYPKVAVQANCDELREIFGELMISANTTSGTCTS